MTYYLPSINSTPKTALLPKLPMKDAQDTLRGKCNQPECNCKGYRILQSHQLCCEYCGHPPARHVMLIELGECQECDTCDKYEYDSKEPCSDADCVSCGCRAIHHVGAQNCKSCLWQAV